MTACRRIRPRSLQIAAPRVLFGMALVGYLTATFGLPVGMPLAVGNARDSAMCEANGCRCRTQGCGQTCCCSSHQRPPSPRMQTARSEPTAMRSCCSKPVLDDTNAPVGTQTTRDESSSLPWISSAGCQGPSLFWVLVDAKAVPPVEPQPNAEPFALERVTIDDVVFTSLSTSPPVPPPRV